MADEPSEPSNAIAFPHLNATDFAALKPLAVPCTFEDGQIVFHAGDPDLDLFVVESGALAFVQWWVLGFQADMVAGCGAAVVALPTDAPSPVYDPVGNIAGALCGVGGAVGAELFVVG